MARRRQLVELTPNEAISDSVNDPSLEVMWSWAIREMLPWHKIIPELMHKREDFERLNQLSNDACIFEISDRTVNIWAKHPDMMASQSQAQTIRAARYKAFFQNVIKHLPHQYRAIICVSLGDGPIQHAFLPTFAHQKTTERVVLLPDVDFLLNNFYAGAEYADKKAYADKKGGAIFVGSTTGGSINEDVIMSRSLPRLEAAEYFWSLDNIDFLLPHIVQVENESARQKLASLPFCAGNYISWQEQLGHRFLISIDGNGATCSRVVAALKSNSILMKYHSPYVLYYFPSLTPWVHYIPINSHADVEKILKVERCNPGHLKHISALGKKFFDDYLTKEKVEIYMSFLLTLYSSETKNC
jgi:hypothetical protein